MAIIRKRAKKAAARKPCRGCGKPKGPGNRRIYCAACSARRKLRACVGCGELHEFAKHQRTCDACKRASRERERVRKREDSAQRRQNPETRERWLAAQKKSRQRAASRAARERARAINRNRTLHRVPARAIALAIRRAVEREERAGTPAAQGAVLERMGISNRRFWAWEFGQAEDCSFSSADQVLTALGLHWWDVWTEDTVRIPLITVARWRRVQRKRPGNVTQGWEVQSRRYYGDAGPDHQRLAAIEEMLGS